MLAFAGLRVGGEVAQVLVVSQPPPLACVAHNIFGEIPDAPLSLDKVHEHLL